MNELQKNIENKDVVMTNNNQRSFDGVYLTILILKHKLFLSIFVLVCTITAGVVAFNLPNWYFSVVSAVPPKQSSSTFEGMLGNLNSTLKEFGLTKLSGKSDNNYSFLVILQSRAVKDSLIKKYNLAQEYDIPIKNMDEVRTAFDDNVFISQEPEGNLTITVWDKDPQKAADIANDYIAVANDISIKLFHQESSVNRDFLETRINQTDITISMISDSLQRFSKAKNIFSPMDQAKSISTALAEIKAEILKQEIILDMLKSKYGDNDPYTLAQKNLISQLKSKVSSAENEPGFGGNFPLNDATKVGIIYMKLYAEFETFTKLKSLLLPMLEEAKINENRNTQSLFIVDKAIRPEKKGKPKRSIILLGAFVGSLLTGILFLIIYYGYKDFNKRYINVTENLKKS